MQEFSTSDKQLAPFLLAGSFNGLVKFLGFKVNSLGDLELRFSTQKQAEELIAQYETKTEPRIPSRDIFEATETFWKKIAEIKKSRNGENYGIL